MNCTRIEKLIPLYVSGDLKAPVIDEVRRHAEICAHCREIVADFEESQSWLREFVTPKFDESVFDDLRDAVRREMAQPAPSPSFIGLFASFWNPRLVIGGSLALIILIAGLVLYTSQSKSPHQNPIAIVDKDDKDAKIEGTPEIKNAAVPRSEQNPKTFGRTRRPAGHAARLSPSSRNRLQNADIAINQSTNQDRDPEMLRIEIQTADPNIRIIWLAPKDQDLSSTRHDTNDR
jgi:hypothetical protein